MCLPAKPTILSAVNSRSSLGWWLAAPALAALQGVVAHSANAQADAESPAPSFVDPRVFAAAEEYFRGFLSSCPESEVRCVFFPDGDPRVGWLVRVHLDTGKVVTSTEIPNHADRRRQFIDLTPPQLQGLKSLLPTLPPSADKLPFADSVSIAVHREGAVHVFRYSRRKPPVEIQRLYELSGGTPPFSDDRDRAPKTKPAP